MSTLYCFNQEEAISRSVSIISTVSDGFESNKSKIVKTSCNVLISICKTIVNDQLVECVCAICCCFVFLFFFSRTH